MIKQLIIKNFLKISNKQHNDKYDYSKVTYVNNKTEVIIICPNHGEFLQIPHNHLNGNGCPKCAIKKRSSNKKMFIINAGKIHGENYDYSKVEYVNARKNVIINCLLHGDFLQTPDNHLRGQCCPICAIIKRSLIRCLSEKDFIKRSNKIHYNKYNYSKIKYRNYNTEVVLICPKHGEFLQLPECHLRGNGCPKCNSSKGELKIINFLDKSKIEYITQKRFYDCRNPKTNQKLKYDFYIPSRNLLIEYDGEQHFKILVSRNYKFTSKDLKSLQYRDQFKTQYAKKNNIKLLRIKYTKINQIEKILEKELQT